jgi:hypothetical protein
MSSSSETSWIVRWWWLFLLAFGLACVLFVTLYHPQPGV